MAFNRVVYFCVHYIKKLQELVERSELAAETHLPAGQCEYVLEEWLWNESWREGQRFFLLDTFKYF